MLILNHLKFQWRRYICCVCGVYVQMTSMSIHCIYIRKLNKHAIPYTNTIGEETLVSNSETKASEYLKNLE